MMQRTSARFSLRLGLFALFSLLAFAACDSGGGEDALAPGTFEAAVTGDREERLEGTASFSLSDGDGVGSLFSLRLSTGAFSLPERPPLPDSLMLPDTLFSPGSIETGIFLESFREGVPSPGTYRVGFTSGTFNGFGLLTDEVFGFELLLPLRAETGTVTITEASAARVSGTFAFTASGAGFFESEERVEVSGRFAALAE